MIFIMGILDAPEPALRGQNQVSGDDPIGIHAGSVTKKWMIRQTMQAVISPGHWPWLLAIVEGMSAD
jgi:hypothetical protein